MDKIYKVNDYFVSLQGEGANAGIKTLFVRFAGCNMKCPWCDTDHNKVNYEFNLGEFIVLITNMFKLHEIGNVTFTGGEPLLQLDKDVVTTLAGKGYKVCIETNGTIQPREAIGALMTVWRNVWITCSPKGLNLPSDFSECKIVLDNEQRVLTLLQELEEYDDDIPIYIQPCDRGDSKKALQEVYEFLMKYGSKYDLRISYQIHKLGDWK